jgi:hypothetical protein
MMSKTMNKLQIFYGTLCLASMTTTYTLKMQSPESICTEQGLTPGSTAYNACVEQEQQRQAQLIQKIMVEERAPEPEAPHTEQTFAELDGCLPTVELDDMGNPVPPSVPTSVCHPSAEQIARM